MSYFNHVHYSATLESMFQNKIHVAKYMTGNVVDQKVYIDWDAIEDHSQFSWIPSIWKHSFDPVDYKYLIFTRDDALITLCMQNIQLSVDAFCDLMNDKIFPCAELVLEYLYGSKSISLLYLPTILSKYYYFKYFAISDQFFGMLTCIVCACNDPCNKVYPILSTSVFDLIDHLRSKAHQCNMDQLGFNCNDKAMEAEVSQVLDQTGTKKQK